MHGCIACIMAQMCACACVICGVIKYIHVRNIYMFVSMHACMCACTCVVHVGVVVLRFGVVRYVHTCMQFMCAIDVCTIYMHIYIYVMFAMHVCMYVCVF